MPWGEGEKVVEKEERCRVGVRWWRDWRREKNEERLYKGWLGENRWREGRRKWKKWRKGKEQTGEEGRSEGSVTSRLEQRREAEKGWIELERRWKEGWRREKRRGGK